MLFAENLMDIRVKCSDLRLYKISAEKGKRERFWAGVYFGHRLEAGAESFWNLNNA